MVMMSVTDMERIRTIARKAHEGQTDKQGQPYIDHPLRVAQALRDQGFIIQAAALLHDVLEDTSWTEQDLRGCGVPDDVLEIVKVLTRTDSTPYTTFIESVAKHRGAAIVKVADLLDNLDPDRVTPDFELPESLRVRYLRALKVLLPVILR